MHKRIYIIGNSASGKTSLAKQLAKMLKIKSYDLDDFYWQRKFTKKRKPEQVEKLVKKVTKKKSWIIEGVYSSCVTCSLDRADLIVWLDYPFHIIAWRLFKRQFKRREKLGSTIDFIHYAWDYYRKPTHKHHDRNESTRHKHQAIVDNYPAEIVTIRNKRELKAFLSSVKPNHL
jgi:adenylate kinase family enzyme